MVKESWGDDGSLWDHRPHLAGSWVVLLVKARGLPAAEVCHKPPNQIGLELGAVDHLDKEAVRDRVERLRDVHRYCYWSARGLTLVEARDHPSRNREQGRSGGLPLFEAVLGGASTQRLHDGREEELLQYLRCRAEQIDGAVGAALVSRLPCFQNRDYDGVLTNYRDVKSSNWEDEELRQEGQAVLTKMAEVEHGKSIRLRLPYGHCDASLVERPVWGLYKMVVVDIPHYLLVPGLVGWKRQRTTCSRIVHWLRVGVGFSLEGDWNIRWGTRPLAGCSWHLLAVVHSNWQLLDVLLEIYESTQVCKCGVLFFKSNW